MPPDDLSDTPVAIAYRMMTAADLDSVPLACQGSRAAVAQRIAELGSSAVLAFDGAQHVAQLQFRRYDPALRSSRGIWDADYWGAFGEHAPQLPSPALNVFCFHVGQRDDSEVRDPRYAGRGIGLALLDELLAWADARPFTAVVAKHTPPFRTVMGFMGGQPAAAYEARGFETIAQWVDPQLRATVIGKRLVPDGADPDDAARVGCCVRVAGR